MVVTSRRRSSHHGVALHAGKGGGVEDGFVDGAAARGAVADVLRRQKVVAANGPTVAAMVTARKAETAAEAASTEAKRAARKVAKEAAAAKVKGGGGGREAHERPQREAQERPLRARVWAQRASSPPSPIRPVKTFLRAHYACHKRQQQAELVLDVVALPCSCCGNDLHGVRREHQQLLRERRHAGELGRDGGDVE